MGSVPNVLIISPSKGLTNVQDFVKKAKANPGTFNFASLGVGSAVYLSAERFRVSAGYDAVHIPFKGGPEALTEIIAGRVDYYFCPIADRAAVHQGGQAARSGGLQPAAGGGAARMCRPRWKPASSIRTTCCGSACSCRPRHRATSSTSCMPR